MTDYVSMLAEKRVMVPVNMKPSDLPEINDPDKAIRAIQFIQKFCCHTKGRWKGIPFYLLDWQFKTIWELFGTVKSDGFRQYRTCYMEIPKKNGKSELAAAIALKLLVADDEQGGEVYSAAADIGQAGLVYDVAADMVRLNPTLKKRLKILDSRKRMIDYKSGSFYQVLSAEVKTKHGINPSGIIFDELHAQPNRNLWDTLVEGTDYARDQQLVFAITTAGVYDPESICWEVREHARQVAEKTIEDPELLPVLFVADKKTDDWENPEVWKRVNPSLGQIFDMEKIEKDYQAVKRTPSRINNFLRFRLNIWTSQLIRWIDPGEWDECAESFDNSILFKRRCYIGLDLSSKIDLTAAAFAFEPTDADPYWRVMVKCYCPEQSIAERTKSDRVQYGLWVDAGHLIATPGNRCDYSYIESDILKAAELYDVVEVAFDPWNATHFANILEHDHGLPMVEHRQGYVSMNEPCKEFEAAVKDRAIRHDGNPVLRWCVDNLVVAEDPSGNLKPNKKAAREKIDAAVAVIMAYGRGVVSYEPPSVYDKRGIIII